MYKITIEKIEEVSTITKEYQRVADYGNPRDKDSYSFDSENEKKYGGPQYDYVTTEKIVTRTTKIYEQNAESLDLVSVIKAVNNIIPELEFRKQV